MIKKSKLRMKHKDKKLSMDDKKRNLNLND